jgi:hypothetical protein
MRALPALVACLILCKAAAGDVPVADKDQVVITGIKNPDMRSYRAVVAGLDAFNEQHHLAPQVPEVKFRLRAGKQTAAPIETLSLRIVGDDDSEPVQLPIDADGFFVVPRIQAAYDSKADLVLNQKKGKFRAEAEVRTPGLPDNVRRLGDMRLECRVRLAIGKYEAPFWIVALVNGIFLTTDWCSHEQLSWPVASDIPLAGATLVHGDRRVEIKLENKAYQAPTGDKSWPDDTRIELRYAE